MGVWFGVPLALPSFLISAVLMWNSGLSHAPAVALIALPLIVSTVAARYAWLRWGRLAAVVVALWALTAMSAVMLLGLYALGAPPFG